MFKGSECKATEATHLLQSVILSYKLSMIFFTHKIYAVKTKNVTIVSKLYLNKAYLFSMSKFELFIFWNKNYTLECFLYFPMNPTFFPWIFGQHKHNNNIESWQTRSLQASMLLCSQSQLKFKSAIWCQTKE